MERIASSSESTVDGDVMERLPVLLESFVVDARSFEWPETFELRKRVVWCDADLDLRRWATVELAVEGLRAVHDDADLTRWPTRDRFGPAGAASQSARLTHGGSRSYPVRAAVAFALSALRRQVGPARPRLWRSGRS